jgi:hypothetical protein
MHNMENKLLFLLFLVSILFLLSFQNVSAQGVAINTDGTDADASSMLDVKSTSAGMLIPRMTQAQRDAISSPATSLLIFQTDNTPGYYYWDGSAWVQLFMGDEIDPTWDGDPNTTSDIGRTGKVGIGTTSPSTPLYVDASSHNGTAMIVDRYASGGVASIQAGPSNEYLMLEGQGTTGRVGVNFYSSGNVSLVNGGGYVGVGTNSPTAKFHVDGSVRFQNLGTGTQTTGLMVDATGNVTGRTLNITNWDDAYSWGDHAAEGYLITEVDPTWNGTANQTGTIGRSGKVGIGTTSPDAKFHVDGDTYFGTSTGTNPFRIGRQPSRDVLSEEEVRFTVDDTYYTQHYIQDESNANFLLKLESTGSETGTPSYAELQARSTGLFNWDDKLYVATNGNVGIGTTSPEKGLHISTSGWDNQLLVERTDGNAAITLRDGVSETAQIAIVSGDLGLRAEGTLVTETFRIQKNTGNVGIGSTTPASKLAVGDAGNANHMVSIYDQTADASTNALRVKADPSSSGGDHVYGIVSTVNSGSSWSYGVYGVSNGGSGSGGRAYGVRGVAGGATSGYNYAVRGELVDDGNSGTAIAGVDNAAGSLNSTGGRWAGYFVGDVNIDGDLNVSGSFPSDSRWTLSGTNLYPDNIGWNVGIGTTSPLLPLDIRGDIVLGSGFTPTASTDDNLLNIIVGSNASGATNGISFYENTGGFGMKLGYDGTGAGATNKMAIYSASNTELVTFENGGNVGIGTSSPSYKLHVAGRLKTDGINETSDIRLKKNINTIEKGLEKVLLMRGVNYEWKDDNMPGGTQIGLIAQEVEKILPEVVDADDNGYKSIQYSVMVALVIEAIKEQQNTIIEQQQKYKEQQNTIIEQQQKYDALSSQLRELEKQVEALKLMLKE